MVLRDATVLLLARCIPQLEPVDLRVDLFVDVGEVHAHRGDRIGVELPLRYVVQNGSFADRASPDDRNFEKLFNVLPFPLERSLFF